VKKPAVKKTSPKPAARASQAKSTSKAAPRRPVPAKGKVSTVAPKKKPAGKTYAPAK
jgi:hypothetical protein